METNQANIGESRIEGADNGALDGQTLRLLRAARYFPSRGAAVEFVGRQTEANWTKWIARLAADYAAED